MSGEYVNMPHSNPHLHLFPGSQVGLCQIVDLRWVIKCLTKDAASNALYGHVEECFLERDLLLCAPSSPGLLHLLHTHT